MTSLSLVFDLVGRDISASKAFKNVGDSAERAGKQGENFGGLVSKGLKVASGALLGAGIIQGFKSLYDAAAESAKIGRLTEQVIKSTGGTANVTAKQVGGLAAALAKKTGIDDEAIQSGENLLLTFTNVRNEVGKGNDIFNQATGIITDMSVALGQDTSSSAIQLGKALNDPIKGVTALQRVGVSFTQSQKDQIRTLVESGKTMDAQKLILAELGKEFGGAAEAASTPFTKLQQRLGDLAETLGSNLIPYVDRFANFMMDDVLPAVTDVGGVVAGTLGPALGLTVDLFKSLFEVIGGVAHFFNDLPGPLKAVAVSLGAMAVLKGPIGSLFDTLRDTAQTAALRALYLKDSLSSIGGAAGVAKAGASGLVGFFGGPWGLALTGATVGISLLTSWLGKSDEATKATKQATQDYADALRSANGVINESVRQSAAKAAQDAGLLDVANKVGIALPDVTSAITDQGGALNSTRAQLEAFIASHTRLVTVQMGKGGAPVATQQLDSEGKAALAALDALNGLAGQTTATGGKAAQLAEATGQAAAGMGTAKQAADQLMAGLQDTADAASEARTQTDLFKTSLDILTGQNVSLLEVQSQLQNALAAATGAMNKEGGAVLDAAGALNLHSENGRKAADVLLDVRNSGNELISTMIQQGRSTAEVTAADANLRAGFVNTARQMGISQAAALKLADQILGIPAERKTQITADTGQATTAVKNLQTGINNLHGRTVQIKVETSGTGAFSGNTRVTTPGFSDGGFTGPGGKHTPAGVVHAGEFVFTKEETSKAGVGRLKALAQSLRGYAGGGLVSAPATIKAELDARSYNSSITAMAQRVAKSLEPVTGMMGALQWARSQVGKPYIWGGVGPGGYDCSGFMSAITNVIRGRSPYSRVGSTASFPWGGFAGGYGAFTIGSTPNAGGGIGHMAGTLLGVNVESTGSVGVRVGGSARGASNGLFGTRAHIAMANGGVIGEPVSGIGHYSGRSYSFGERGPETVTPGVGGGPIDLSDATIDRLAVAMIRGAGASISAHGSRQAINSRSWQ